MTTLEGKIDTPGDPMCLYSALSVAAIKPSKRNELPLVKATRTTTCARNGATCPRKEYRLSASDSGFETTRPLAQHRSDHLAPGIWNAEVKQYFVEYV